MQTIEQNFIDMENLSKAMMEKRARGEKLGKEDNALLKEAMRAIHTASAEVAIEDLASLLDRYDIGLGMAHIEPSYERINSAFAWLEARESEGDEDLDKDDF